MRTFACFLFMVLFMHASAQRECATQAYTNTTSRATATRVEAFIKQQSRAFTSGIAGRESGTNTTTLIRIPVVVHVLYNTAAQNISEAQIRSGIAALNRDFRKQNKDTANIPDEFKSLAADVQIEFHLATADPHGVATTGIIRKQTGVTSFNMDDKIKLSAEGGDDAWDSKQYLNIWLVNTRRLLGYATMPGGDEKLDGLVINATAFGTINVSGPYNLGRTVVHEAGHWLGLRHIWGDESCGDDGVEDTPQQGGYTAGCPSGIRSSCKNGTAGDMYMNYMDFTNDACLNLFTYGQKDRMRALFASGGPRHSFLTSTGLNEPWAETAPTATEQPQQGVFFSSYPNPATQEIALKFHVIDNEPSGELQLLTLSGTVIRKIRITSATQKINLENLQPGMYLLQGMVDNQKIIHKIVKL